ncbi:MAG: class I SAM-dependent methyltransferase [Gemmatimonadota bacterium]|nr:class I SAM-dependent methyltransferase [Gemmatimonadota bacterium]MDH4349894.1 class I SAM-dependent methyltransferase [Gemmatimonadota bacterium]MDH5196399.1 class I SAM-dependent methyltransferase [Gemmatimonadota bacterium]
MGIAPQPATDFSQIKSMQKATWGAGNFAVIARHTVFPGELLCEAVDLRAGQRVLDVATGSGNAALSAARRGAEAVGTDYVPELLEWGRKRAEAEQLGVVFEEGDCEGLTYPEASFDVALSLFGTMFAPNHQRCADELLRVCRPGGKIGLACWTPEGFWGQVFALQSKYFPPAPGLTPPTAWGTESHLRTLFGDRVTFTQIERRMADFRHASADHWLEFFQAYFGPMLKAFERVGDDKREQLAADLKALATEFNRATDGGLVISGEYLEVVLTKR